MHAPRWELSDGSHVDEGVKVANLWFWEMARGMLEFFGGCDVVAGVVVEVVVEVEG